MPDFTAHNAATFGRLYNRLAKIQNPDATALMVAWEQVIRDDNREGILAGTDKDGMPMYPVKYRPKGTNFGGPTGAQRLGQAKNRKRDLLFGGLGPQMSGLNNNLTRKEYERLGGPPLAPRGQFSRVITNLLTGHSREGSDHWTAFGYWDEVVDVEGRPFLRYHFDGGRNLPPRDLRGVRPRGREIARKAMIAWARDLVFSAT